MYVPLDRRDYHNVVEPVCREAATPIAVPTWRRIHVTRRLWRCWRASSSREHAVGTSQLAELAASSPRAARSECRRRNRSA